MSRFDVETQVESEGEQGWSATLEPAWSIGANLNGGYTLATLLRLLREVAGHPDPVSATAHFLRPVQAGRADLSATVVRAGRNLGVVRGTLSLDGTERLVATAAFGTLDQPSGSGPSLAPRPPDLPDPDRCVDRAAVAQGVDVGLLERLDVRLDPGPLEAGDAAVVQGWVRFTDEAPPDVLALAVFCDAFPPAVLPIVDDLGWVPTIELTIHVRHRPAPGWVCARFECDDVADGRMIESGTLWDRTGAVVARCRQVGLVLGAERGSSG